MALKFFTTEVTEIERRGTEATEELFPKETLCPLSNPLDHLCVPCGETGFFSTLLASSLRLSSRHFRNRESNLDTCVHE